MTGAIRKRSRGTVKLARDRGSQAQHVVSGPTRDPKALGVTKLDFGQLDSTHSSALPSTLAVRQKLRQVAGSRLAGYSVSGERKQSFLEAVEDL